MKPFARLILAFVLVTIPLEALAFGSSKTWYVNCDTKPEWWSIDRALDFASDGDTIEIIGACTETVTLDKGVTLDGRGTASLSPADPGDATITITARDATVRGLSLESPALFQIFIFQAASVRVDGSTIRNAQNFGLSVSTLSYLVLTDNTIADNGLGGMVVLAGSEITVGAVRFFDPPQPNTFANNGPFGMGLAAGSGARILGPNVFTGNNVGIGVVTGSQARIVGNVIDGNGIGVFVDSGANVQLATQGNAVPVFNEVNSGTNAQLGIACKGGSIQGFVGLAPAAVLPPTPGVLIGSDLGLATHCLDQTALLP